MAENRTAARPYAEAVFALANASSALPRWSDVLRLAGAAAGETYFQELAGDPRVKREALAGLLLEVCGANVPREAANFLRLLAENRRLALLPEIAAIYEEMRAEAEGRIDVTVRSAFPLPDQERTRLTASLKRRFAREVNLTVDVDESLVGGIVIRAGDTVIDGSIKGRLDGLAAHLTQ